MNNRFHKPHLFQTEVHKDFRGSLSQTLDKLLEEHLQERIVQTNLVKTKWGVFRGLHWQKPPHEQLKVVQVISGTIQDVCVNIRNFDYEIFTLTDDGNALVVPYGWAHGFYVSSPTGAIVQYHLTKYWSKEHEMVANMEDPRFKVNFPNMARNERDTKALLIHEIQNRW